MKKKNINNSKQPITKEYFDQKLKRFATKTDLKNVEKALRSELLKVEEKIEDVEENLNKRIDSLDKKIDNVEDSLTKKIDGVEETLIGKIDKLMNQMVDIADKFDTWRTENEIGAHQTSELQKQIDSHEKRIKSVEQRANIA